MLRESLRKNAKSVKTKLSMIQKYFRFKFYLEYKEF